MRILNNFATNLHLPRIVMTRSNCDGGCQTPPAWELYDLQKDAGEKVVQEFWNYAPIAKKPARFPAPTSNAACRN